MAPHDCFVAMGGSIRSRFDLAVCANEASRNQGAIADEVLRRDLIDDIDLGAGTD
jgi:hypothetical protein